MAREPDTLCAGDCGRLLWGASTSLPAGQRMCRSCRAKRPKSRPTELCAGCGKPLVPGGGRGTGKRMCRPCRNVSGASLRPCVDCGTGTIRFGTIALCEPCSVKRCQSRSRTKHHGRRDRTKLTDVTPAYERWLRERAKCCPLCDVRLVDTPILPNSKELDHMVPLGVGGAHTICNVRIICRKCNRARPLDGSDFVGQLGLWAEDPSVVPPKRPHKAARHVEWSRRERWPEWRARGQRAAALRADRWKWQAIADELDFSGPGGALLAARSFGEPEVVARWPARYERVA